MVTESCIYSGTVHHERIFPTQHSFQYDMSFFWLKLNELDELNASTKYFGVNQRSWYEFRTSDYMSDNASQDGEQLQQAVRSKLRELGATSANGDLFFMGQVRALGIYFSPVNFFFHRPDKDSTFDWMLAEVSNTPWNERHYYLVDLKQQADTEKAFHVSPFNPINMTYKWQIAQPDTRFNLALSCHQEARHFTASMHLDKQELSSQQMRKLRKTIPSTTVFSIIGIYWQALKLFAKRTPFYGHPGPSSSEVQENNHVTK